MLWGGFDYIHSSLYIFIMFPYDRAYTSEANNLIITYKIYITRYIQAFIMLLTWKMYQHPHAKSVVSNGH